MCLAAPEISELDRAASMGIVAQQVSRVLSKCNA
jgi:hypothetical protein